MRSLVLRSAVLPSPVLPSLFLSIPALPNLCANLKRPSGTHFDWPLYPALEAPGYCQVPLRGTDPVVSFHRFARNRVRTQTLPGLVPQILVSLMLVAGLVACSSAPDAVPAITAPELTSLESIPAPVPSKYPSVRDMRDWKNPYLVVRDDGIGFVDMSNHEIHILKPEEIPAELASLPSNAWPYGRVVLVAEATPRIPTDQAKAEVRKNRALLVGTLKEFHVQIREAP